MEKRSSLVLPVEPYTVSGHGFGDHIRRHFLLWAVHLGDDVLAEAGTPVKVVADGEVVWSETRRGRSEKKNWGGIVVVKSQIPNSKFQITNMTTFYSVYGHIADLKVKVGDKVTAGQAIGAVAMGNTPENGWWEKPHLHFGIYTGPWKDEVLAGWWRPEHWRRTKVKWWVNPREFLSGKIKEPNS
jgi:murein DD-endopeptidase MepM/ murein hydrolase activator NlpD